MKTELPFMSSRISSTLGTGQRSACIRNSIFDSEHRIVGIIFFVSMATGDVHDDSTGMIMPADNILSISSRTITM